MLFTKAAVGYNYDYEYQLKDHLGNVRESFKSSNYAAVNEKNFYYPFGLTVRLTTPGDPNKYLYNPDKKYIGTGSKELEVGAKQKSWFFDGYHGVYPDKRSIIGSARFYDPALGRWHTMDPADEFNSPYVYVGNDPINYIDPDGASDIHWDLEGNMWVENQDFWLWDWLIPDNYYYTPGGKGTTSFEWDGIPEVVGRLNTSEELIPDLVHGGIMQNPYAGGLTDETFTVGLMFYGSATSLMSKNATRIVADDAFVHVTTQAGKKSILKYGLDIEISGYVTQYKYIKGISPAKKFETVLYSKAKWSLNAGKFSDGAYILEINSAASPRLLKTVTNFTDGIPQWKYLQNIPKEDIINTGIKIGN